MQDWILISNYLCILEANRNGKTCPNVHVKLVYNCSSILDKFYYERCLSLGSDTGRSHAFQRSGKPITIDSEGKRCELELSGADVTNITHLFGFETSSGHAF